MHKSIHKKQFYFKKKPCYKIENILYLHDCIYNAFKNFIGGIFAAYTFATLDAKFAWFVLITVCRYLTLFAFLRFNF